MYLLEGIEYLKVLLRMCYRRVLLILFLTSIIYSCGGKKEPEQPDNPTRLDSSESKIKDSVSVIAEIQLDTIEAAEINKPVPEKPIKEKHTKSESKNIKSISGLWNTYKLAKEEANKAIEKGDIDKIIMHLNIAGESAIELGRDDIAAWQFNNIGHYSIEEFKKRTGYDDRIRAMATMPSGKDKSDYIKKTKDFFRQEISLLDQAESSLNRAQIIDDELEKSRRTEVIERNLDFINWVKEFLH